MSAQSNRRFLLSYFRFGYRNPFLVLLCGFALSATITCSAQTPPAPPAVASTPQALPLNPLEQIETALQSIVRNTQASVVSIEGRLPSRIFTHASGPSTTSFQKPKVRVNSDKSEIPSDPQAAERENQAAQRAMQDAQKLLELAFGPKVTGSGFLLKGGFVVTTSEVIEGVSQPVVILSSGKRIPTDWVEADPQSNLAVLKISGVEPQLGLTWGDSNRLLPGSFAITIGNQSGFSNSVALGLISGMGRSGQSGSRRYSDLIQFQGAVSGGGSGGPLLNSRGEVIGMIVATPAHKQQRAFRFTSSSGDGAEGVSPPEEGPAFFMSDGVSNTGFALPSNSIQSEIQMLSQRVVPAHQATGWLGMRLSEATSDPPGALIESIYIGSPADHDGLEPGDIVTSLNGQPIHSCGDLRDIVRNVEAGEALRFEVLRGKSTQTITITSEVRPSAEKLKQMRLRGLPEQTGALPYAACA